MLPCFDDLIEKRAPLQGKVIALAEIDQLLELHMGNEYGLLLVGIALAYFENVICNIKDIRHNLPRQAIIDSLPFSANPSLLLIIAYFTIGYELYVIYRALIKIHLPIYGIGLQCASDSGAKYDKCHIISSPQCR